MRELGIKRDMCPTDKIVENSIELDLVALREDGDAVLDWLDQGFSSTTMWKVHSTKEESSVKTQASQQRESKLSHHRRSGASLRIRASSRGTSERRAQRLSKGRRSLRTSSLVGSTMSLASTITSAPSIQSEPLSEMTEGPISEDDSFEMSLDHPVEALHELPELVVVITSSETTCSDSVHSKQCKFCARSYRGFGEACSTCRKTCGRSVQQCRLCGDYFQGFMDTCGGCSTD